MTIRCFGTPEGSVFNCGRLAHYICPHCNGRFLVRRYVQLDGGLFPHLSHDDGEALNEIMYWYVNQNGYIDLTSSRRDGGRLTLSPMLREEVETLAHKWLRENPARKSDEGEIMEINIDPKAINEYVADKITESAIGEAVRKAIENVLKDLNRSWDNPIESVVRNEVAIITREVLHEVHAPAIRDRLKVALANKFSDEFIDRICEAAASRYA